MPKAVISVPISWLDNILSKRARSTFRILPRKGKTAWFSRFRACLADPPAEQALKAHLAALPDGITPDLSLTLIDDGSPLRLNLRHDGAVARLSGKRPETLNLSGLQDALGLTIDPVDLITTPRPAPEGWAEAALTPRADIPNTPGYRYGYLWWLIPYEVAGDTYWAAAMTGNGGNRVMVLPDFALTVVFTNTDFNTPGMHQNAQRFFETEIVARLGR